MKLTSEAFKNEQLIPVRYTCDGEDINPSFQISGQPPDVKSYCLIMDDLDAMAGDVNFLHWTMWNIPPQTIVIKEGELLDGVTQGRTSFGHYHYGGPCPPKGELHRYRFRLFALNIALELSPDSSVEDLEKGMFDHVLDEAVLSGTYKRKVLPV